MGISVDESVPDDLALIVRTPKGRLLPYPEGENVVLMWALDLIISMEILSEDLTFCCGVLHQ